MKYSYFCKNNTVIVAKFNKLGILLVKLHTYFGDAEFNGVISFSKFELVFAVIAVCIYFKVQGGAW